ncbi:TPA: hypothetical protein IRQ32_004146 [Escherichia coli]|nr:hypothetical protein [Escherichia coli]
MCDDKKIEFSTSDVLNALLHKGQSLQHLATQESVENLRRETKEGMDTVRREMDARMNAVDKRLDRMEQETERRFNKLEQETERRFNKLEQETGQRFNKLETKFDRLQWFIVAAALALIFKDYIFRFMGTF